MTVYEDESTACLLIDTDAVCAIRDMDGNIRIQLSTHPSDMTLSEEAAKAIYEALKTVLEPPPAPKKRGLLAWLRH